MIKGIFTQTRGLTAKDLKELHEEGFEGLALLGGEHIEYPLSLDYQEKAAESMFQLYETAKSVGFSHFLIDISGGLGKIDNNWWWKKTIDKFSGCSDIVFFIDEAWERIIEQGLYNEGRTITEQGFRNYFYEVDDYAFTRGVNLAWGSTIRNTDKLPEPVKFISSYDYKQNRSWNSLTEFVLMYGELKWGGSLRYKSLLAKARSIGIKIAYLYQYDSNAKFDIKVPYTWFNSLLKAVKLYKPFCKWMRKRFADA